MITATVYQDINEEFHSKIAFLSFPVLPVVGSTLNLTICGFEKYYKVLDIEYCADVYSCNSEIAIPVSIDIIVKEV
ncbi:hypothetical protein [Escherichia coli]|uniref:Uncharacterized protein n=1 Tax=Escherichia phage SP27 TaxID=2495557 RepID=A0A5A4U5F7_9CAUD|nr:hypothetical protein [Escherichia coli]MED6561877.1 hypothetical protein [Escherichia coli O157]WPK18624.1 hypothetical protein [Salmonella phage SD-2_S15]WPK19275.1 hypothetical protein [Salmonella phage SD-6_S16]WPK20967.1 hypothetical protein [Salmonella phage SD-15_S21]BBM61730.1 hypothetical protein EO157G_1410 [Escherichia phage SP27]